MHRETDLLEHVPLSLNEAAHERVLHLADEFVYSRVDHSSPAEPSSSSGLSSLVDPTSGRPLQPSACVQVGLHIMPVLVCRHAGRQTRLGFEAGRLSNEICSPHETRNTHMIGPMEATCS
ncbi:unnamed protein product [Protopolystoma xenopodis]|uniref:Uncharacterized protein n=1 Tax=Protopolystoma xenopodis TaxID=117903 RepID=A0A448X4U1_9PLAT|nr:unnamed protein product [Protopolystoma xenopodis]